MAIRRPSISLKQAKARIQGKEKDNSSPVEVSPEAPVDDISNKEEKPAVRTWQKPKACVKKEADKTLKDNAEKSLDKPDIPDKPKREAAEKTSVKKKNTPIIYEARPRIQGARKQIFISARLPAAGVSWNFDLLSQHHDPKKALRLILKQALNAYEAHIRDGSFEKMSTSYETLSTKNTSNLMQTSRTFDADIFLRANAFFNPLGFESDRAVGFKIATAALAVFFNNE